MFTPFSGVVAAHCDMEEMDASSSSTVMPGSVMPGSVILAHDMSTMLPTDSMPSEMNAHGCCDDLSLIAQLPVIWG